MNIIDRSSTFRRLVKVPITMSLKFYLRYFLCFSFITAHITPLKLSAQCTTQVTHTSGTTTYGCTDVTVTSSGTIDVNSAYCASTFPYFIGYTYNGGSSGNGSYTFTFNPPISAATLNFSGASNTSPSIEEIILYVNGQHYAMPSVGTGNGCDQLATLSASGDLLPCLGCSTSGWNGTQVTGPITTLTVLDTVLGGAPNGSIFSLFICTGNGTLPVTLGSDTTVCNGSSLQLNAVSVGATSYSWSGGQTGTSSITVSTPGTYSVTVSNGLCTGSDTINVSFSTAPVVDLGSDTIMCSTDSIILTATTVGATYHWQNNSTSDTYTAKFGGNYSVTVTANGCSTADTIYIGLHNGPHVDLGDDTTLCTGNDLYLDASPSGATIYSWNTGQNNASQIRVTTDGIYAVTVSDGMCLGHDSIVVSYNTTPVVSLGNDTSICSINTLFLDAGNAGASFLWQDNSTSGSYNVSSTGNYSVTVTQNGCSAADTVNVNVIPQPVVNLGNDTAVCSPSIVILDAFYTGANYVWQDNSSNSSYTVINTGTYAVTVNNGGCIGSDSIFVTVNMASDSIASTGFSVCAGNSVTICSQLGFASYTWSNGANTSCINTSVAGSYNVLVTDNNNCTARSNTIVIGMGSALPAVITASINPICAYDSTRICATTGFTTYNWNNGAATSCINTSVAGSYQVTVTDGTGCTATSNIIALVVNQPPAPRVTANRDTICTSDTATICVTPLQSAYHWNGGATSNCINVSQAGNYYVTVTDNNGCTAESNHQSIHVYPQLPISITQNGDTLTVLSGITYQWYYNNNPLPNAVSNQYIATEKGSYTVQVTDSNGCNAISTSINFTGLQNLVQDYFIVYPNPTFSGWNLNISDGRLGAKLEVFDTEGQIVYQSVAEKQNTGITFEAASGIYLLQIITPTGNKAIKLIKLY